MKLIGILLGILLLACGFCFGVYYGQETTEPKVITTLVVTLPAGYWEELHPDPITVSQGLEMIRIARYYHSYLVDKGEPLPMELGGLKFHANWVKRYDQLRDLIIRLSATYEPK